ncbi:MAG TPA: hypothetical protein VNA12_01960 [Mycobacteriales bacterium]|nr:hypothetical protein [Mycobacteriales bacterium]
MSRCRLFAGLIAAALLATGGAVAVAATPVTYPTATITTSKNLAPGATGNAMKFDVKNTADPTHVIDYVRIYQPADVALSAATAPAGWTATKLTIDNSMLFTPTVGGLPGGATLTFALTATIANAPASDRLQNWVVGTRFQGADRTLYQARPTAAGALQTTVRVLKVVGTPDFTPAFGAGTSGPFTTAQDNRKLTYSVQYVGSGNPTTITAAVTPAAAAPPAVADTWTPTSVNNAGTTALEVAVKFGSVGTGRVMQAGAEASGNGVSAVAALVDSVKFDVQSAFAPAQAAALTPTVLSSTTGTQTFTLKVSNTGDSVGKLLPANTRLTFANATTSFAVPLKNAQDVAKSTTLAPSTSLVFESLLPTGALDGTYDVTFTYGPADNHGAVATGTLPVTQDLLIDTIFPKVTGLTLASADGQRQGLDGALVSAVNADTSRPYVFTRGDTLNFGGTVDADVAEVTCAIVWLDATVAPLGTEAAECDISDSNALTGSYTATLPPAGATAAQLVVTVEDAAGNTGESSSAPALLDVTAPRLGTTVAELLNVELPADIARSAGRTGCTGLPAPCTAWRTLTVTFDEPVVGSFDPSDFVVVAPSAPVALPVATVIGANATRYTTTATLVLSAAFPEDATPVVTYLRLPTSTTTAVADAAGNVVSPLPGTIADGVAPRHPVLTEVQGKAAASGKFWTNDAASVDFLMTGVTPGHVAKVLVDDGDASTADTVVCLAQAQIIDGLDGVECSGALPAAAGTADQAFSVYVLATDAAGNSSLENPTASTLHTVLYDGTAPTILSAALVRDASGEHIVVTFSEDIASGSDNPADWRFYEPGSGAAYLITRVGSVAGQPTKRRLDLGGHDPFAGQLSVAYASPGTTAYADYAGNTVDSHEVEVAVSAST